MPKRKTGAKYRKYLKGRTWACIRLQRLALVRNCCVLCGLEATQVHHSRYPDTLGRETISDIVSLCKICHERYHSEIEPVIRGLPRDASGRVMMSLVDSTFYQDELSAKEQNDVEEGSDITLSDIHDSLAGK